MSVTYGFYNSVNHDRTYNASHMSRMFDGIIRDGVFASIGSAFAVTASSGHMVNVAPGKAWFNHTWIENDAILPVILNEPELILDRIDALVIEINSDEMVRANSIKIVAGVPDGEPVRPTMLNTDTVHQYPICYIYRKAESTGIEQSDITYVVGSDECPLVTGILETISTEVMVAQWEAQFREWFEYLQNQLSEDAAGNLQKQIGTLSELRTTNKADLVGAINEQSSALDAKPSIFYGTTEPSADLGKDGDLYFQYEGV